MKDWTYDCVTAGVILVTVALMVLVIVAVCNHPDQTQAQLSKVQAAKAPTTNLQKYMPQPGVRWTVKAEWVEVPLSTNEMEEIQARIDRFRAENP